MEEPGLPRLTSTMLHLSEPRSPDWTVGMIGFHEGAKVRTEWDLSAGVFSMLTGTRHMVLQEDETSPLAAPAAAVAAIIVIQD